MAPGADGADSGLFAAQLYNRGDPCGKLDRITTLAFECDRNVTKPTLRSAQEVDVCSYVLKIVMREWCDAEAEGLVGAFVHSPRI